MRILLWLLMLAGAAQAHDFWLKPQGKRAVVYYGHAGQDDRYAASSVKKVAGLNAQGEMVGVKTGNEGGRVVLIPEGPAVQLGAEVDTGFWVKTVRGWKNVSLRQSEGALLSEWSIYYSKALLAEGVPKGAFGHQLEIVPLQVGPKSARLKVLLRGKPLADAPVYAGHDRLGETDESGELTVNKNGSLVLAVAHKEKLENNPDAERLHLHAVLTLP